MQTVALLHGDQALVDEYNRHVEDKLIAISSTKKGNLCPTVSQNRGMHQLFEDITTFFPFNTFLGYSCVFNAKTDFYRLMSVLLSDLALIFDIRSPTPLQVNTELHARGIIDKSDMANIKVCLLIANEIRLKTYLANNRQKEVLSPVPRYAKIAGKCPNNFHFYPDFDEEVAVRLLSTSWDMHQRCAEFYVAYDKKNEIDIRKLWNSSIQLSEKVLIGHLYIRLQNFPKAFELLEPLSKDSGSPAYTGSLYELGLIYLYYEEYGKSIEYFQKAMEEYSRLEHQSEEVLTAGMSIFTYNLAEALQYNGECKKALIRLEEAIKKHNEIYGEGSLRPELRRLLHRLGSVYTDMGYMQLATQTFQNLELMLVCSGGGFNGELIGVNILMARSLTKTDSSESLIRVEKALHLAHKVYGNDNPSAYLAAIYHSVATVYVSCNRKNEALSWYERSLRMFHLTIGDNPHPGTVLLTRIYG